VRRHGAIPHQHILVHIKWPLPLLPHDGAWAHGSCTYGSACLIYWRSAVLSWLFMRSGTTQIQRQSPNHMSRCTGHSFHPSRNLPVLAEKTLPVCWNGMAANMQYARIGGPLTGKSIGPAANSRASNTARFLLLPCHFSAGQRSCSLQVVSAWHQAGVVEVRYMTRIITTLSCA
jgi:hypothetical protein